MNSNLRFGMLTFAAAMALPAAASLGQSFSGLGSAPSNATGISRDGSVVVGYVNNGSQNLAFRSTDQGVAVLGPLAGGSFSYPEDVSGDGSMIVGWGDIGGLVRPWKWTSASGMQALPLLPNSFGWADTITANGIFIGGWLGISGVGDRAVLWPAAGGVVDLGLLPGHIASYCDAISENGQVVWGWCRTGPVPGAGDAFRWTSAGGMVDMSGVLGGNCRVFRANHDGSILVGRSQVTSYRVFLWSEQSGKIELGALPGDGSQLPRGMSDDGSVVVGGSSPAEGSGPFRAFMWTTALGMVDLNAYLPTLGINLEGWTLTEARGISADGRIIAGTGNHLGQTEAWVTVLGPAPCYPNCDGSAAAPVLNVNDFTCFLNRFAAGDAYANCDASTSAPALNVTDFLCFMNRFAAGCL